MCKCGIEKITFAIHLLKSYDRDEENVRACSANCLPLAADLSAGGK